MVVLAVTWLAKPGKEQETASLFLKLQAESRKEPGCVMYLVHQLTTDPRRFLVYEQYQNEAGLEAHRNSPHFLQYARKLLPKVGDRIQGELYKPLAE